MIAPVIVDVIQQDRQSYAGKHLPKVSRRIRRYTADYIGEVLIGSVARIVGTELKSIISV